MLDEKGNVENLKNCYKYNIKLVKNTNSLNRKLLVLSRRSFDITAKSCYETFFKIKPWICICKFATLLRYFFLFDIIMAYCDVRFWRKLSISVLDPCKTLRFFNFYLFQELIETYGRIEIENRLDLSWEV